MRFFVVLLLLINGAPGNAIEIEGFAGASATRYDSTTEADTSGVSARFKLNFYSGNRGWFITNNSRGISPFIAEWGGGYALRTSETWFFEGGLGASASPIFGVSGLLLLGTGYRVTPKIFVNFPLIISLGGPSYWSPHVGVVF